MNAPPRERCAGKKCAIAGCNNEAAKKLLCRSHYEQRQRQSNAGTVCSADGCANMAAHGRRGMCNKHYLAQYRRTNENQCTECGRPAIAKSMCAAHYSRAKRGYDMEKPLVPRYNGASCSVSGCDGPAVKLGMCSFHYMRQRDGVPLDAPKRAANPEGFINGDGYRVVTMPDGNRALKHRVMMSESLGRALLGSETVHHKNGDRDDNRLKRGHEFGGCPPRCCNLELWSSKQPKGQRVADKIAYAHEILDLYSPVGSVASS